MGAGIREADKLARQQEESMERKQAQTLKECPLKDCIVVRDDAVGLHLIKQCPNRRTQDTTLQQKTISDIMDERDSTVKALKKYGQHSLTCNWSRLGADPCTCGLKEAFENIGAKLE